MKMKIILLTLVTAMIGSYAFAELTITKKPKRSVGNNEEIVLDVSGFSGVDTNSYEYASTARITFPNKKAVMIKSMNPDYEGSEVDNPTNCVDGTFYMELDGNSETNSMLDYSALPEDGVSYKIPDGGTYSASIVLRAKTVDLKMNRRMPKMMSSEAAKLPDEVDILDATSTVFNVGKLTSEYNKLAQAFNQLRAFILSNTVDDAKSVLAEKLATEEVLAQMSSRVVISNKSTATVPTPAPTPSPTTITPPPIITTSTDPVPEETTQEPDPEPVDQEEEQPTVFFYKVFKDDSVTVTVTPYSGEDDPDLELIYHEDGYDVYKASTTRINCVWYDSDHKYLTNEDGEDVYVDTVTASKYGVPVIDDAVVLYPAEFATRVHN